MKTKSRQSITPGITTTIGKCLGIYSKKLSAIKSYYGLMVSNSGITDAGLDRLAHLHDSVVHTTVGSKMCDMGKRVDVLIAKWDAQLKNYGIVVDNVDIMTKPRRDKTEKSNTMHHMVQAIAVEERVRPREDLRSKEQDIQVEDLKPADVVPTTQDTAKLLEMMVGKVTEIWSKIPALKGVKLTLPDESHQYTEQMSKKTDYVSMRYCFFFI